MKLNKGLLVDLVHCLLMALIGILAWVVGTFILSLIVT